MIFTIGVYKGGTGKTTTAAAFAYYLAQKTQKKTLVIDLNSQGSLSMIMAAHGRNGSIADAIHGAKVTPETVKGANKLFLLPASVKLKKIREPEAIADAIREAARGFHNVVIDTPPENEEFLTGALLSSGRALVPLHADIYGVQGFLQMVALVKQIQERRPALEFAGVLLNEYNARARIARTTREAIMQAAEVEGVPYLGEVRKGVAIEEAAALRVSVFDHAPTSKPAEDFAEIFNKIIFNGGIM